MRTRIGMTCPQCGEDDMIEVTVNATGRRDWEGDITEQRCKCALTDGQRERVTEDAIPNGKGNMVEVATVTRPGQNENLPARVEDASVTSLVQMAIEKGVDVEVIERLVALQERVYDRDARAAFIAALASFQADCPQIIKTRENTQFSVTRSGAQRHARYAPLEDIDRIARPIAASHGLVWTWDTKVDDKLMHVTCRVLHAMGHSESATVSMPYESKAGSSPQQKYGATQTYGMRYSLTAALGITTADEDTDGHVPADVERISDQQAADLSDLIDEVGVRAQLPRLLKWLRVETIADIPAVDFKRAVDAVEAKRGTHD